MGFRGKYLNTMYEVLDPALAQDAPNSPACFFGRAAGFHIEKIITLDASNTSDVKGLFQFTKTVQFLGLYFEITDASTLVNCTGLYFDAYDGAVADVITLDGAVISGFEVDSCGVKDEDVAAAITVIQADEVRVTEPAAGKKTHAPFMLTAKSGQTDLIRLHYTTTDTPINATLKVCLDYCLVNGGTMSAV